MDLITGLFGLVAFLVLAAVFLGVFLFLIWVYWDFILRKEEDSELRAALRRRKEQNKK